MESRVERRQRLEHRKAHEDRNVFSRLPALYAASRTQGLKFLALGGGLSILEWRTLWDLHEAGPLTVRDLALLQRLDHSLLSRALPDMKDKGYIATRRDPEDGRQTLVEITKMGRAAYAEAAPVMAQRRAALREVFTEAELDDLQNYFNRLEDFLRVPVEELIKKDAAE